MSGVNEKIWFQEARHIEEIKGALLEESNKDDWRKIRERMKTVSVALVLCLNIGVDPPDTKKPSPCARKEAWIDPNVYNPQKSAQKIALSLQRNYEKLQPRARYKSANDPTLDCVKKLCVSMRRNAKDERILFHFNGHGVPKPTDAGEIWVFNKNITQYIPLSLFDLQSWMGVPSVYLWDCNSAGTIVNMFLRLADDHSLRWMDEYQGHDRPSFISELEDGEQQQNDNFSNLSENSVSSFKNCMQLAACSADETLPLNPDLPADLFTSCLTTPIQTSLLCHMLKTGTKSKFPPNVIDELPGQLTDRRTLLGELNWIFTAITDTIAWDSLPMETFQKLFRQDLLIASLFRSFLLAERTMWENGCHAVSSPQLPTVHSHPLWEYWDYILDLCLTNLYNLLTCKEGILQLGRSDYFMPTSMKHNLLIETQLTIPSESEYSYSWFFVEQLQAFEIWLKFAADKHEPPEQLPVVLQVLLSQVHRVRALELLARFVDLGSWAVFSALSVGIFPYVLKLLQCGTKELRPSLAFIWAKILSVDPSCQNDLIKDNGYFYFLQILSDHSVSPRMKIVPAYVMATLIYNSYRPAQEKLVQSEYVNLCTDLMSNSSVRRCKMLVLWLLIGLGRLWSEYDKAHEHAIRNVIYERVFDFLVDDLPEVRAAAVYALGCFVHNPSTHDEPATEAAKEVCDQLLVKCAYDGSVLVRSELASAIQWFIIDFQSGFTGLCTELDRKIELKKQAKANILDKRGSNQKTPDTVSIRSEFSVDIVDSGVSFSNQRSNSSIFEPNQAKKFVRKLSLLTETHSKFSSPLPVHDKTESISSDPLNVQILDQISELGKNTLHYTFDKIWLSILNLGLDPFDDVSQTWKKLIKFILKKSVRLKEAQSKSLIQTGLERKNSLSHSWRKRGPTDESVISSNDGSVVKFQVGSPQVLSDHSVNETTTSSPKQETNQQRLSSTTDIPSLVEPYSMMYTPKRSLFGVHTILSPSNAFSNGVSSSDEGLVKTHFVDWCSKTFTQPIYRIIYENASTSTRNSLVNCDTLYTVSTPTDWASHTYEGLLQRADQENVLLRQQVRCESQIFAIDIGGRRKVSSLVWSFLRPFVYVCNGVQVKLFNYSPESQHQARCVASFKVVDEKLFQDDVSDMMIVNELTHELLLTGTRNGLVKIWDPTFSQHGHELKSQEPVLVTTAYLLNCERRISKRNEINTTLYRWDQPCGKILCAGNVRICRIWDAWAEKTVQDYPLNLKRTDVTSIASDLSHNLISCGFSDGAFRVFDTRLSPKENEKFKFRDSNDSIVGLSILSDNQQLLTGSNSGCVRLWDHRAYHEPVLEFNVKEHLETKTNDDFLKMESMDVQNMGQVFACSLSDSTVQMFDIFGKKCFSRISSQSPTRYFNPSSIFNGKVNHSISSRIKTSTNKDIKCLPSAVIRFHQTKMLLAIASGTNEQFVAAYGLP